MGRMTKLRPPVWCSRIWEASDLQVFEQGGQVMKTIEESIEIEVPVSTAYNQWTQFESFPQFMDGIERVEQKDDKHLRWTAGISGDKREWDAEITEQNPDHRVAWRALDRDGPNGVVTFHKLDEGRTKVMVQMDYEPEGVSESIGSLIGLDSHRVKGDLESFKEFIEGRAQETGAWRGNIDEN
jgi:uncharacterized membrane protein